MLYLILIIAPFVDMKVGGDSPESPAIFMLCRPGSLGWR